MPVEFSHIKSAILAAGLGKRMDPLTARHLPKPLFPLGGKVPMAEVWVRRMVDAGVVDISMNLCVKRDLIRRHFGDGLAFGAAITYVEEQVPTGTLGGVCKQALGRESKRLPSSGPEAVHVARDFSPATAPHPEFDAFKGSTVVVPSGDIVTNFSAGALAEMHDIHTRAGAAFTMVLAPVPWERRGDYGTVVLQTPEALSGNISQSGRIKQFVEKNPHSASNLNNASIYMIEMDLLRELDPLRTPASFDVHNPFYDFGKHVFPALLGQLPYVSLSREFVLWGVQYDGAWFDVGQKRDYLKVNQHVLDGQLNVPNAYEERPWGRLGRNVSMDFSKVTIVPPVVIGNNCVIGHGVTLGPYAIAGDDWRIENGARIEHSVLWERYAYFSESGIEIPLDLGAAIDPHSVGQGVTIRHSIVAGGAIQTDLSEKTVDVQSDGQLGILDIDWVPTGPRH